MAHNRRVPDCRRLHVEAGGTEVDHAPGVNCRVREVRHAVLTHAWGEAILGGAGVTLTTTDGHSP